MDCRASFRYLNGAYREMYLEPLQSAAIEIGATGRIA